MKLGRFDLGGRVFFGIVERDQVRELDGSPFDSYRANGRSHALTSLKTLAPCVPPTFFVAGLNYLAHIEWGNKRKGLNRKPPSQADIGFRAPTSISATNNAIVIPADSPGPVQYEGELVAVIGKKARNVSEADALKYVLGYTLGNDVSERHWQENDRSGWRAKNCDSFNPMGPYIVTDLDPMNLSISVRINGKTESEYNTSGMLFSAQHFISRLSRYMTLWPGSVIWFGTDNATIPPLAQGDVVEVVQQDIGILRNPVCTRTGLTCAYQCVVERGMQ